MKTSTKFISIDSIVADSVLRTDARPDGRGRKAIANSAKALAIAMITLLVALADPVAAKEPLVWDFPSHEPPPDGKPVLNPGGFLIGWVTKDEFGKSWLVNRDPSWQMPSEPLKVTVYKNGSVVWNEFFVLGKLDDPENVEDNEPDDPEKVADNKDFGSLIGVHKDGWVDAILTQSDFALLSGALARRLPADQQADLERDLALGPMAAVLVGDDPAEAPARALERAVRTSMVNNGQSDPTPEEIAQEKERLTADEATVTIPLGLGNEPGPTAGDPGQDAALAQALEYQAGQQIFAGLEARARQDFEGESVAGIPLEPGERVALWLLRRARLAELLRSLFSLTFYQERGNGMAEDRLTTMGLQGDFTAVVDRLDAIARELSDLEREHTQLAAQLQADARQGTHCQSCPALETDQGVSATEHDYRRFEHYIEIGMRIRSLEAERDNWLTTNGVPVDAAFHDRRQQLAADLSSQAAVVYQKLTALSQLQMSARKGTHCQTCDAVVPAGIVEDAKRELYEALNGYALLAMPVAVEVQGQDRIAGPLYQVLMELAADQDQARQEAVDQAISALAQQLKSEEIRLMKLSNVEELTAEFGRDIYRPLREYVAQTAEPFMNAPGWMKLVEQLYQLQETNRRVDETRQDVALFGPQATVALVSIFFPPALIVEVALVGVNVKVQYDRFDLARTDLASQQTAVNAGGRVDRAGLFTAEQGLQDARENFEFTLAMAPLATLPASMGLALRGAKAAGAVAKAGGASRAADQAAEATRHLDPTDAAQTQRVAKGGGGSEPPTDPYDVEAWNKYYAKNPNAPRTLGAAAADDPAVFGGGSGGSVGTAPSTVGAVPSGAQVSLGNLTHGLSPQDAALVQSASQNGMLAVPGSQKLLNGITSSNASHVEGARFVLRDSAVEIGQGKKFVKFEDTMAGFESGQGPNPIAKQGVDAIRGGEQGPLGQQGGTAVQYKSYSDLNKLVEAVRVQGTKDYSRYYNNQIRRTGTLVDGDGNALNGNFEYRIDAQKFRVNGYPEPQIDQAIKTIQKDFDANQNRWGTGRFTVVKGH
ncbi:MAG: hypothetical protein ACREU9_00795 [Gammaproteobacteria bacterium]